MLRPSSLADEVYDVVVDTSLTDGHLTYGELTIPGASAAEVLFSTHCCHPSLCNDNLSGVALCTWLARHIATLPERRYSYRFLFIPGTIGSITWLALHEASAQQIRHGLVVACVGDPGHMHYKKSRRGDAEIDVAVLHVLQRSGHEYSVRDFSPYGYDERQYCSPGFDLPVGSLTRTPHGCYPEYHTSADDLDLVQPQYLADSLEKYIQVVEIWSATGAITTQIQNANPSSAAWAVQRAGWAQKCQDRRAGHALGAESVGWQA